MKAVKKMLRALIGASTHPEHDCKQEARACAIRELAERQHDVARRVRVLEWQVLKQDHQDRESDDPPSV